MTEMMHFILDQLYSGEEARHIRKSAATGKLFRAALYTLGDEGYIDVEARGEVRMTTKGMQYLKERLDYE